MSNLVKGLAKVHNEDIGLVTLVAILCKVMDKLNKLGLTRQSRPEPVLELVKNVMFFSMAHDMAGYDMLK